MMFVMFLLLYQDLCEGVHYTKICVWDERVLMRGLA
jgi:hypothetical protein